MSQGQERRDGRPFPLWIPDRVKGVLTENLAKEPIDLRTGRHFVSGYETADVREIIGSVPNPVFIGLYGSRANLTRPPLFAEVDAFDAYHANASQIEGSLERYLAVHGLLLNDYDHARRYLERLGFNEGYRRGNWYPQPLVDLLVRDIDLLIISDGEIAGGLRRGERTNVAVDLNVTTPQFGLFHDIDDYLAFELSQAVPLKY
jgi:hypothetical protein